MGVVEDYIAGAMRVKQVDANQILATDRTRLRKT